MADLAKYGEVVECVGHSDIVSDRLGKGWELISAKIVETQRRVHPGMGEEPYIEKRGEVHYIIGKPRKRKPA